MRAGPSGSLAFRTATPPSASRASSTPVPSGVVGRQRRPVSSRAGIPLYGAGVISEFLEDRGQDVLGAVGCGRLDAQSLHHLAIPFDVFPLIEVQRAGELLDV